MKKIVLSILIISLMTPVLAQKKSFYDFKVKDIDGNEYDLINLKGKKVLVVNTASKCGLTPQYKDLQKLYTDYMNDNFVVIGFPANDFLRQEPGTNNEIKSFCSSKYNVSFPMMAKISVKGKNMHPLYQWLTQKDQNGIKDSKVKWNFQKYLIDREGNLVNVVSPKTSPLDKKIIDWIKK